MDLTSLTPLAGGWSGETFLGEAAGARCVVRIYAEPGERGLSAPEIDASLLRLVRGLVPVPDVLEVRRGDPRADAPGLLVTSFVEGVRGDELLPTLSASALRQVGAHLGCLAATLAAMPMLRLGPFVDADLTLGTWPELEMPVPPDLPPGAHATLATIWEDGLALLDTVTRRSLVHSDLNPKNVLLDPSTLDVTALVDWEFAHAGHPFTDLGNLLRHDHDPAYVDGVLGAWCERHGGTPAEAHEVASAADLPALLELASRRGQNPAADRAHARVLELVGCL